MAAVQPGTDILEHQAPAETLKLVKLELLLFSITSAGHSIQHHQAQNDYWNSGRPLFMHITSNYLFCLDVKREEQVVQ